LGEGGGGVHADDFRAVGAHLGVCPMRADYYRFYKVGGISLQFLASTKSERWPTLSVATVAFA